MCWGTYFPWQKSNFLKLKRSCWWKIIGCTEKRDFTKAEKYFIESLQINEKQNYFDGIADNYIYYGNLHRDLGRIDKARECYEKAIQAYQKLELNEKATEVKNSIEALSNSSDSEISNKAADIEQKMEVKNYGSCTQYSWYAENWKWKTSG